MLEEPKNNLDNISDTLSKMACAIELQASISRKKDEELGVLREYIIRHKKPKEKRCYAEEGEPPLDDDDDDDETGCEGCCDPLCGNYSKDNDVNSFEKGRTIGRVERTIFTILSNEVFEYNEDGIQKFTHEDLYKIFQNIYEALKDTYIDLKDL